MAFPSDIGTKADDLTIAWGRARQFASSTKRDAQNVRALSVAGTLAASNVLDFATRLADARFEMQKSAAVPGIGEYARSQINDPAINIAAEFTAMVNAIDACIAWVVANFPKDAGGFLLAKTIGADGRTIDRVFTAGSTATLRTQLDALIATID